jgi:serpin B
VSGLSLAATNDQDEVVKENNEFAVELYAQLRSQSSHSDGFFFSPESIWTTLAMTYAGARGDTAGEMAKTLHFMLSSERMHSAMGALLADLNGPHDDYQLRVSNALWGQEGYPFLNGYLKRMRDEYGAGLNQVDFNGATERAGQTINSWIETQTENTIHRPITPHLLTIPTPTMQLAANAVYFKGDWQTPFDKTQTRNELYKSFDTTSIWSRSYVQMMHRTGEVNYFNGGTFQVMELPYKGNNVSMIIFLPNDAAGLSAFEESMTAANMEKWLGQLRATPQVAISLPRFHAIATFDFDYVLGRMGIRKAFDPRLADFSGMAGGGHDLFIESGTNVARAVVTEEATEASAEAIIEAKQPTLVVRLASSLPSFRADHPFVFLIRENGSGAILFMGRVNHPAM